MFLDFFEKTEKKDYFDYKLQVCQKKSVKD